METQSKRPSVQFSIKGLLIAFVVVAVLVSVACYLTKSVRGARKIQTGDSSARVRELLGSPTEVFYSDAEMRTSILGPMSYVFSDVNGKISEVPVSKLPVVAARAEWFEYTPTAGHLVYYDEQGVQVVFWGGT